MRQVETRAIDVDALMREVQRYLAAVDAFRAAGYPPQPRGEEPRLERSQG